MAFPHSLIKQFITINKSIGTILVDFRDPALRADKTYRLGADTFDLRKALGQFATGVTIVTTISGDGVPHGLTINSFTSVSLDPPLILICIAKDAGTLAHFLANEMFAINILEAGQTQLARTFATHNIDRFANTDWHKGELNAPLLNNTIASLECKRAQTHDAGDHVIIIGEVQKASYQTDQAPLLYFSGKLGPI